MAAPPRLSSALLAAALCGALLAACGGAGPEGPGAAAGTRGATITVLAVWTDEEQQSFEAVLHAFEARTGIRVVYDPAGHGVPEALAARIAAGRTPDVAFLPQPGLLRQYARGGRLVPLDGIAGDLVDRNYDAVWRGLGSVDGRLYGVWFKAANKSLVWYNEGAFERAGVVPPDDLPGLLATESRLRAAGIAPFALGGADGWTLTDWFENLYLRVAGPTQYDWLAAHDLPWTMPTVVRALTLMDEVLAPADLAGGTAGAARTTFEQSVQETFASPPAAGMVFEGDFVGGTIRGATRARIGVDADVFPFPAVDDSGAMVVGGGDAAVLMRRSDAGAELIRYLAGPEAAAVWAARGGFISPNLNVDLTVYPDAITRGLARGLLQAGNDFRFDLSDLQPAAFGGIEGRGMRARLQQLLVDHDPAGTAAALEADARAAYAP